MVTLTTAQRHVSELVAQGRNIRVSAHAGSGKTRTLIEALKHIPDKAVLFLEFNKMLRKDAAARVRETNLTHVNVQNYDSVLVNYYDRNAPNTGFDIAMSRVIEQDIAPDPPLEFSVLVIDEAQDMREDYYKFVRKIIEDNILDEIQLIIVGDTKQTIYDFLGAKDVYMRQSHTAWPKCVTPFEDLELNATFRFGSTIAHFVNFMCRKLFPTRWKSDIQALRFDTENQIFVENQGGRVFHFVLDPLKEGPPEKLLDLYQQCVEDVQLPSNRNASVGVLAHSTREDVQALWTFIEHANARGITHRHCDETDVSGGVTLRTIYTTKGKEYKHVFLFVTERHLWLASRNGEPKASFDNLLYVGLTRGTDTLVIVESLESIDRTFTSFRKLAESKSALHEHITWTPLDAHTWEEAHLNQPCARMQVTGAKAPKALSEMFYNKLDTDSKSALLRQIMNLATLAKVAEDIPGASEGQSSAHMDVAEITSLEALIVDSMLEYKLTGNVQGLRALLSWCKLEHPRPDPHRYYVRVSDLNIRHEFLPKFREMLNTLPLGVENWKIGHWSTLCLFHKRFHYGHLIPEVTHVRESMISNIVQSCLLAHQGQSLKLIDPVRASNLESLYPQVSNYCTTCYGLFVAVNNRELWLYVSSSVHYPRDKDLVAASLGAYLMQVVSTRLVYLGSGVQYDIRSRHEFTEELASHFSSKKRAAAGNPVAANASTNARSKRRVSEDKKGQGSEDCIGKDTPSIVMSPCLPFILGKDSQSFFAADHDSHLHDSEMTSDTTCDGETAPGVFISTHLTRQVAAL